MNGGGCNHGAILLSDSGWIGWFGSGSLLSSVTWVGLIERPEGVHLYGFLGGRFPWRNGVPKKGVKTIGVLEVSIVSSSVDLQCLQITLYLFSVG